MKTIALALAAITAMAVPAASSPGQGAVTFRFEVSTRTGKIMLSLHGSEASYRSGPPTRSAELNVAGGQSSVTFNDLPAGDYAMKAFHDVNGNGKLDTNPFGIPTEPYAFSNNAKGSFGPASWASAKFAVSAPVTQSITLR